MSPATALTPIPRSRQLETAIAPFRAAHPKPSAPPAKTPDEKRKSQCPPTLPPPKSSRNSAPTTASPTQSKLFPCQSRENLDGDADHCTTQPKAATTKP